MKIKPLDNYCIKITTQKTTGIFDVKPYLKGSAFQELKNISYFNTVRCIKYGITWPNEQDFSLDTILYDMKQ